MDTDLDYLDDSRRAILRSWPRQHQACPTLRRRTSSPSPRTSASTSYSRDRSLPKHCPRVGMVQPSSEPFELIVTELFDDGD